METTLVSHYIVLPNCGYVVLGGLGASYEIAVQLGTAPNPGMSLHE